MSTPETEQIEADIEQTRADLAATFDELGYRLELRKAQAKQGLTYAAAAVGTGLAAYVLLKVVKRVRS